MNCIIFIGGGSVIDNRCKILIDTTVIADHTIRNDILIGKLWLGFIFGLFYVAIVKICSDVAEVTNTIWICCRLDYNIHVVELYILLGTV